MFLKGSVAYPKPSSVTPLHCTVRFGNHSNSEYEPFIIFDQKYVSFGVLFTLIIFSQLFQPSEYHLHQRLDQLRCREHRLPAAMFTDYVVSRFLKKTKKTYSIWSDSGKSAQDLQSFLFHNLLISKILIAHFHTCD